MSGHIPNQETWSRWVHRETRTLGVSITTLLIQLDPVCFCLAWTLLLGLVLVLELLGLKNPSSSWVICFFHRMCSSVPWMCSNDTLYFSSCFIRYFQALKFWSHRISWSRSHSATYVLGFVSGVERRPLYRLRSCSYEGVKGVIWIAQEEEWLALYGCHCLQLAVWLVYWPNRSF